jgi:hypothetical protein
MAPPPVPNPLAASADKTTHNTLSEGMVRLPIGWPATDPQPNARTLFWLVIPTRTGGRLTIVHEGGGTLRQLVGHDGAEILVKGGSSKIEYDVPVGRYGLHYVIAEGGSPRTVSCQFVQECVARTSPSDSAPMFAPWNFFYWPSADPYMLPHTDEKTHVITWVPSPNRYLPTEIAVLRKYARAFGKNPDLAEKWERHFHVEANGPEWEGHCHLAAAASILFEEPVARTVSFHDLTTNAPAKESFSIEEIKYLASEWVGNFSNPERVWALEKGGVVHNDLKKVYYPMVFKPGEPMDAAGLAFAIRSYLPKETNPDEMARKTLRSQPHLVGDVKGWFGELAASFYQALIDQIKVDKQALVADLRGAGALSGPAEVWNHAVFYYKASYEERTPDHGADADSLDMWITCSIMANADLSPGTDPKTGELVSTGVPNPWNTSESRTSFQQWRLVFDGKGNILGKDTRNEWMHCNLSSATGSPELYAPAFLLKMKSPTFVPNQPSSETTLQLGLGNQEVGSELVAAKTPLAKLRQRYERK